MKIAKIIETIKAMEDNKWYIYRMFKRDGEPEKAAQAYGEYIACWSIRRMLENPDYAASMRKVYFKEEDSNE